MEENDYGEKYKRLHTFAIGNDIIQWWASTSNKEAKLIGDAGCVVDFAGSISKHSEYEDWLDHYRDAVESSCRRRRARRADAPRRRRRRAASWAEDDDATASM